VSCLATSPRPTGDRVGTLDYAHIRKELGDILWFVAAIAEDHGMSLASVAEGNITKLSSRHARGTIQGSGDDR
jgi:NTP pyrophosphatase (non-canonical NTP hydrolase)